jgi:hypothetical protein
MLLLLLESKTEAAPGALQFSKGEVITCDSCCTVLHILQAAVLPSLVLSSADCVGWIAHLMQQYCIMTRVML